MAETFSNIVFLANGVDISADVLATPAPRMQGMGIKSVAMDNRVGSIATLTFSVDNSAAGSRGLGGYNSFFGLSTRIQVYFEYDGIRRYKFAGYVDLGGVTIIAGTKGPRRVDVKCSNIMKYLADHELDLIGYQTNKTMNQAIDLVFKNCIKTPMAYNYQTGSLYSKTFPTVFDVTRTNTKAIGEIQKMVMSEMGRAYITGDGSTGERFQTEGWFTRTDYVTANPNGTTIPQHSSTVTDALLLVNGVDNLLLVATGNLKLNRTVYPELGDSDWTDFQVSKTGSYTFNRAIANLLPRTVDAAATTVLWTLDKYITLTAGEQKTNVRGEFRDPNNLDVKINGIEMVTPVSGTDYAAYANSDGTGTNYTTSLEVVAQYGTADVNYSIKNKAAVTVYVTLLQARGKGVRVYNGAPIIYNQPTYQASYGLLTVEFNMPYTGTEAEARQTFQADPFGAGGVFSEYYTGTTIWVESATVIANRTQESMFCFMCLEPGMNLKISETMTGKTNAGYNFIQGYDWTIKPGKIVEWTVTFGSTSAI